LSRRGGLVRRQRDDVADGHWRDRIFGFDFDPIAPGRAQTLVLTVTSMGGRHVRFLAMQGRVFPTGGASPTGLEAGQTRLTLQINGQQNFVSGELGRNDASFGLLFGRAQRAPWYWFRAPPRMRAGDLVRATIASTLAPGEGVPDLQPTFAVRMMDDALWTRIFAADARAAGWV